MSFFRITFISENELNRSNDDLWKATLAVNRLEYH